MSGLIRTPEIEVFLVGIMILFAAAPAVASGAVWTLLHLRKDWFFAVHAAVLSAVVSLAAIIGAFRPASQNRFGWTAALVLGTAAFAATALASKIIGLRFGRSSVQTANLGLGLPWFMAALRHGAKHQARTAVWLLFVAALEELVYRGVLLGQALTLGMPVLRVSAIILTVLLFAAAHLSLGRENALIMLILSSAATGAVLSSGSVVSGVVAHVLFNARFVVRR